MRDRRPRLARLTLLAGLAGLAGLAFPSPSMATTSSHTPHRRAGTADVAYAGSLAPLNEIRIGPAFTAATGYGYRGRAAGSFALAAEIAAGEIAPNVFESVGAAPIAELEPRRTRWRVEFASSPLVVAYNPTGPYGAALSAIAHGRRPLRALFGLMSRPEFRLGRTDPNLDPQGASFIEMVELATRALHLAATTPSAVLRATPLGSANSPEIFEETALEARLQAGQLDAASAYLPEARALHLPYIALPPALNLADPAQAANYARAGVTLADGTRTHGAPIVLEITTLGSHDARAAAAFVAYVLSPAGRAAYRRAGYGLLKPKRYGPPGAVPDVVRRALGH